MSLPRSRAPVIDTVQEPRRAAPVLVDPPATVGFVDHCIEFAYWALTIATVLYFAWQFWGRA